MGHTHSKTDGIDPRLVGAVREDELSFGEIAIFGAKKVGKTSIAHRFQHNYFTEKYEPTSDIHKYEVIALIQTDDLGRKNSLIFRNSFRKSAKGREKLKSTKGEAHTRTTLSPSVSDPEAPQYRRVSRAYSAAVEQGLQHLKFTLIDTASDLPNMQPTGYQAIVNNATGFVLVCSFDVANSLDYIENRLRDINKMRLSRETPIIIVGNKSDLPKNEKVLSEAQVTEFIERLDQNWSDASLIKEEGCLNMMQDMFNKIHVFAERKAFQEKLPEDYAYGTYE